MIKIKLAFATLVLAVLALTGCGGKEDNWTDGQAVAFLTQCSEEMPSGFCRCVWDWAQDNYPSFAKFNADTSASANNRAARACAR